MSIYIDGMEMPERGHTVTLTIVGSGEAYVEYYDCKPHLEEAIEYKATHVPPHGRLIDADELRKEYPEPSNWLDRNGVIFHITGIWADIDCAPTILPSDKEDGE